MTNSIYKIKNIIWYLTDLKYHNVLYDPGVITEITLEKYAINWKKGWSSKEYEESLLNYGDPIYE